MLVYHRAVRAQNLGGPLDSPLLPALLQQRFVQPQPQPKTLKRRQVRRARLSLDGEPRGSSVPKDDRQRREARRASYEPNVGHYRTSGERHNIPVGGSMALDTPQSMSMAALVRESRSRADALRETPSRTAMRRQQASDRAKTPDHFDSALWHDLPDDIRRHIAADEPAASWFADGPETFASVGASTGELVGRSPANAVAPRATPPGATRQLRDSTSSGIVSCSPLDAAIDFHERISRLTAIHKEQTRKANVEAAEYANRGGKSLEPNSKTLSYEADRLHRANQQHRSEMAQARADVTAKYVAMHFSIAQI